MISVSVALLLSFAGNAFLLGKNKKAIRTHANFSARIDSLVILGNARERELRMLGQRNRELLDRIDLNTQEISSLTESISQKNSRIIYLTSFQSEVLDLKKQVLNQDSLKNELERVSAERFRCSGDLAELKSKQKQLEKEKSGLDSLARLATPLRAYNVCTHHARVSRSGKHRPFLIARRINQTEISFEIPDNPFTGHGNKSLHVVLSGPDGRIINGNNTFTPASGLQSIEYSDSRTIFYEGSRTIQKFVFKHGARPLAGKYFIKIYIDGALSGEKDFFLN